MELRRESTLQKVNCILLSFYSWELRILWITRTPAGAPGIIWAMGIILILNQDPQFVFIKQMELRWQTSLNLMHLKRSKEGGNFKRREDPISKISYLPKPFSYDRALRWSYKEQNGYLSFKFKGPFFNTGDYFISLPFLRINLILWYLYCKG